MQGDEELEGYPSSVLNEVGSHTQPNSNEGSKTRKITVELSESMFQRLEAASNRPGAEKSTVVKTALERFLDPGPATDGDVHEALDRMNGQIERIERDTAIIAETVGLHARYHLTVTPPMPPSEQREACLLGERRFNALVEQVERRVRLGQPLIRKTIQRLARTSPPASESDGAARMLASEPSDQEASPAAAVGSDSEPRAAAEEGGSNLNFHKLPNSFC
ncbi:hypothetical protein A5906_23770 [Bradyrhizobium sacchari]|uniref:Ribbon-helix-helix CopG family protein n=1 Tax=Bradyrhizobium sacchari TaxID=1399419 RepID=A0A560JEI4_9BRAD|nr:hypothetical protein [Bradyrhizobium sacchari]OPZ00047.1 hypothetical protein A5906_23770 [Bradyrhizobium sacchari]TWB51388.1 hypothetical protein FBZ94_110219 [Bradyrhizobium sacchari]TWB69623.1 hypothetical protein FBZ95_109220 [Bradyrhizobium sacchari]